MAAPRTAWLKGLIVCHRNTLPCSTLSLTDPELQQAEIHGVVQLFASVQKLNEKHLSSSKEC